MALESLNKGALAHGLSRIAEQLNLQSSPVAIVGHKGIEAGIAVKLIDMDNEGIILDGVSLNGYTGTRREYKHAKKVATIGLGISKELDYLGMGIYATKPIRSFFSKDNINIGVGFTLKF